MIQNMGESGQSLILHYRLQWLDNSHHDPEKFTPTLYCRSILSETQRFSGPGNPMSALNQPPRGGQPSTKSEAGSLPYQQLLRNSGEPLAMFTHHRRLHCGRAPSR